MLCQSFDDLRQYDSVVAEFRPRRTDDLKPGVESCIGVTMLWEAIWVIEDGDYTGQWAMRPTDEALWPFIWCPTCDLRIVGEG